jgi:iron complex transport system ATP-binding protein
MKATLLSSIDLEIGYKQKTERKPILKKLNLDIFPSQFICLLGPNGSGKSTLLRTLAGLQNKLGGNIKINGKDFQNFSAVEKSRTVAVILTDSIDVIGLNVSDVIALGRIPYVGWSGKLKDYDHQIIEKIIKQIDVESMALQPFIELSDGEKQRVLIGRALAQEPDLLILDEPTSHLDLTWTVEVMLLLRKLCHENRLGIVMSSHDFDLTLRLADDIWLIDSQGQWLSGIPEEMALKGVFNKLFTNKHLNFEITNGSWKICENIKGNVFVDGCGATKFWTEKLIERIGFSIRSSKTKINITIKNKERDELVWILENDGKSLGFQNLKYLENYMKTIGAPHDH